MHEQCAKCHDTGFELQQTIGPEALTITAKWCDCPTARRYLASLRQLGQSPAMLKHKFSVIQQNIIELLTQFPVERQLPPNEPQ